MTQPYGESTRKTSNSGDFLLCIRLFVISRNNDFCDIHIFYGFITFHECLMTKFNLYMLELKEVKHTRGVHKEETAWALSMQSARFSH